MNYPLIAAALYTLGPDICAQCFAFLDEEHLDGIISDPGSRPHRSMLERIEIVAALADPGEQTSDGFQFSDAGPQWRSLVENVFAEAYRDPAALTRRLLAPDFRAPASDTLRGFRPGELIQYDNVIERLAMGEGARSEQVRVREWLGYLAETADYETARTLVSAEGHALELIFRAGGDGRVNELRIRDLVLGQELGLPDYPEKIPPWVPAAAKASSDADHASGTVRVTTRVP